MKNAIKILFLAAAIVIIVLVLFYVQFSGNSANNDKWLVRATNGSNVSIVGASKSIYYSGNANLQPYVRATSIKYNFVPYNPNDTENSSSQKAGLYIYPEKKQGEYLGHLWNGHFCVASQNPEATKIGGVLRKYSFTDGEEGFSVGEMSPFHISDDGKKLESEKTRFMGERVYHKYMTIERTNDNVICFSLKTWYDPPHSGSSYQSEVTRLYCQINTNDNR